ncbi:MAG TPA: peptide-methionine (S)-S-oxide reductase MsrA [Allosphingosinicella sp.]
MRIFTPVSLLVAAVAALFLSQPLMESPAPAAPARPGVTASAVFAGGCFWCTEADFDKIAGVISTTSGYSGGRIANPTYEQVSAGGTGHIEVVRVVYDPTRVSYSRLLARFFLTIDPVDGGGQFCDRGSQYRSAIFVANRRERAAAEAAKAQAALEIKVPGPIATAILPAGPFYPAEDYHQDYYSKNPARYNYYRYRCGRDARLAKVWGK